MSHARIRWAAAALALSFLAGCGGSGDGGSTVSNPTPPSSTAVSAALTAAAQNPANDTSTNASSAFTVLQAAGVPAVTVNGSTVRVNFAVFSDGALKSGLTPADMSFALARVIPPTNGGSEEWISYISRTATATAGLGPGGAQQPPATAIQAVTDPKTGDSQLVYNSAGYYTYTFTANITDPAWQATINNVRYLTNGVTFAPTATQRVAIQLSYRNAAGATVRVNPFFDFTFAGSGSYASTPLTDPATQDLVVSDSASCNTCHENISAHGGGRVAMQYCVMCHNSGTTDPESGNVLSMSNMTHSIHAGRLLPTLPGGSEYVVWGFRGVEYNYAEVGFPQDLRNCSICHNGDAAPTPQGNNWKTDAGKAACLSCHPGTPDSTFVAVHKTFLRPGTNPAALPDSECASCHSSGTGLEAERAHYNQIQDRASRYRVVIESASFDSTGRKVTVKYALTNPTSDNTAYNLTEGCPVVNGAAACTADNRFGNLRLYLAYQNIVGQPLAVTEFSAYNNGGSSARADAWRGVNDGRNRYTIDIPLPADSATAQAQGSARVISVGQVKEAKVKAAWPFEPRPDLSPRVLVNVGVQNSFVDLALTGAVSPPPVVVSNEKCNVCHGLLGTASGSNTLPNAFHNGARNTVESCTLCHDANRSSSTVMTNGALLPDGSPMREQFQSKYMMHGIHSNSKRTFPYTHGNAVFGKFCNPANLTASAAAGCDPSLTFAADVTDYATEALWPGPTVDGKKQINCNACHVNDSYEFDRSVLGAVVSTRPAGSNPLDWNVITPQAASCVSCHNSDAAVNHVLTAGNSRYGNATQAMSLQITETCADCHSPTGFLSVRAAHKQ
jgi:OmcA/MtrC family decaheme c-type cytochrome